MKLKSRTSQLIKIAPLVIRLTMARRKTIKNRQKRELKGKKSEKGLDGAQSLQHIAIQRRN